MKTLSELLKYIKITEDGAAHQLDLLIFELPLSYINQYINDIDDLIKKAKGFGIRKDIIKEEVQCLDTLKETLKLHKKIKEGN